jgi:hypothetical protein
MLAVVGGTLQCMKKRILVLVGFVAAACRMGDAATADAGSGDARPPDRPDAALANAMPNADAMPDTGPSVCPDGLVEDGPWCIGWRAATGPQACIEGSSELVRSSFVGAGEKLGLLAIRCIDEAPQLYLPSIDLWFRRPDVSTTSLERVVSPAPPSDGLPIVAAGVLPDGTAVAVAGSLHAVGPFATLIAEPGAGRWRTSIEAPWMSYQTAGALDDDELLFAHDIAAWIFVRARLGSN